MTQFTVESSTGMVIPLIEKVPIQVLHVDDEVDFLRMAKRLLEIQGPFQVESASSVEEATQKLKKETFEIVVSDYQMPEKNGLEFLQELRDSGNNIPFIIFTGKGREEVAIRALKLSVDQYLKKTGDPETVYSELAHAIRGAVRRKRAEEMLRDSEERYRNLVQNSKDSIVITDLNGNVRFANKATEELTGYTVEEGIGMNVRTIIQKRYWPKSIAMLLKARRGRAIPYFECVIIRKDGRLVPVESGGQALFKDGKIVGVQIITRDISDRRRAEESVKESEEKYRSLFENAGDVIVLLDLKGNVTSINRAAVEYGFKKDDFLGKSMLKFVPKKHWPKLLKEIVQIAQGKTAEGEIEIITPKGKRIARYGSNPIVIRNKVVGVQTILRDITERKMMERTLRESEGKYRSIFELAPVAIATVDLKGVITSCNTLVTSSGYSRDAIIGKHFSKVGWLQMKDLPKYLQMFSSIIRGKVPEPFEVNYRYKDGEPHVGEAYVSLTKQNGKITGIQTIMRDITERKKRERAIQQNQQKFRRLFMDNPEAAVHMDSSFHILDINPRFTKLFGYSLDEVKGRHINDAVVPEDRMEEAERFDKKASRGEAYHEDTVRKRRDGTLVPVSFSAAPIIVEDKVTGHVAIYKDISQLKSTEKALKETMGKLAVMNEKLRVVGRLTRHDIRNKLSAVTGNVFIAKRKLADGHELLENLNETELACQQVVRILDFARTYEMLGIEELTYMNVEKIVGEAVQLFPDLHDVKVVNDCRGLTVLTDSLLRQLFYNMIHNSLKHGGKVSRIRVYCEETEKDRLKLVYEDDGVGIPKSEKEKIFREGYGKGTGYGLYLIRKMSEVYGWTIRETGKHGKNVEFIITIPKMNRNGKRNYRFS